MFDVAVKKTLGEFSLDVRFESKSPVTALFGPSGSGKTSVANAISGLLKPDEGRIAVGGKVLFDSERGINVPVYRRKVRVVFQESRCSRISTSGKICSTAAGSRARAPAANSTRS